VNAKEIVMRTKIVKESLNVFNVMLTKRSQDAKERDRLERITVMTPNPNPLTPTLESVKYLKRSV
jgi:hypothetical protein